MENPGDSFVHWSPRVYVARFSSSQPSVAWFRIGVALAMARRHEVPFRVACIIIACLSAAPLAAPVSGAALTFSPSETARPRRVGTAAFDATPIPLREERSVGLVARAWVNGEGPFTFVLDTGAGVTIVSPRVAGVPGVRVAADEPVTLAGMGGGAPVRAPRVWLGRLSLGSAGRVVPARGSALVVETLPPGVDGIIDPTEAFAPLAFAIDFTQPELRLFDPVATPVSEAAPPPGGAVMRWLDRGEGGRANDQRPYVQLNGARRALIDTGSSLGLVLSEAEAALLRVAFSRDDEWRPMRDIAGSRTWARRVRPITIDLDGMTLSRVPTDVISGAHENVPVLIGRAALRPFLVVFDPRHRLIAFAPRR